MSVEELENEALKLESRERARLACATRRIVRPLGTAQSYRQGSTPREHPWVVKRFS